MTTDQTRDACTFNGPTRALESERRGSCGAYFALIIIIMIYIMLSCIDLSQSGLLRVRLPRALGGDEPHYVLIASSVAYDHDFDLGNDYERVAAGRADAGLALAGQVLDHHTVVLDPGGAGSILWQRTRVAEAGRSGVFRLLPGAPGYASSPIAVERPAHPPALSAAVGVVAAAVAWLSGRHVDVEAVFALVNLAAGAAAIMATYGAGRAVLPPWGAVLACAILTLASPWLAYGQLLFSETAAGLLLVLALGAILREAPVSAGVFSAGAFWIKPPFVCAGLAWIVYLAVARRPAQAARMAAVCTLGGVALVLFNFWLARTPFVSGAEGFVPARGVWTALMTLVSPGHGLLVFAPWVLPTFIVGALLLREPAHRGVIVALLLPAVLYYPVVSSHRSLGGYGYGPRYWVAMMPILAIAACYCVRARATRSVLGSMVLTVALAAVASLTSVPCVRSVMNLSPHVALRRVVRSVF
jgi:hypothetical protein